MKNPMTPDEMKQAIDDNAAGHDMQHSYLNETKWKDRHNGIKGKPLDFFKYQYRRKPEPREHFRSVYSNGQTYISETLVAAQAIGRSDLVERTRWIEDPDWVEPEPEDLNPWRPIVKDEWPKCRPSDEITVRYEDGSTFTALCGNISWTRPDAIEWKYAEDV